MYYLDCIGEPQRRPSWEGLGPQYKLCIYSDLLREKANRVVISNQIDINPDLQESKHEIRIEGDREIIRGELKTLAETLENILSTKKSYINMLEEKRIREGLDSIDPRLTREDLRRKKLEILLTKYHLNVRVSPFLNHDDLIYIIKGDEKENSTIENTERIQMENGDFVSVSEENIDQLVTKLNTISELYAVDV